MPARSLFRKGDPVEPTPIAIQKSVCAPEWRGVVAKGGSTLITVIVNDSFNGRYHAKYWQKVSDK